MFGPATIGPRRQISWTHRKSGLPRCDLWAPIPLHCRVLIVSHRAPYPVTRLDPRPRALPHWLHTGVPADQQVPVGAPVHACMAAASHSVTSLVESLARNYDGSMSHGPWATEPCSAHHKGNGSEALAGANGTCCSGDCMALSCIAGTPEAQADDVWRIGGTINFQPTPLPQS